MTACRHTYLPSRIHLGYEFCACGTYHSTEAPPPHEIYTDDYWTEAKGHSEFEDQIFNVDVLEIGGKTKNQFVLNLIDTPGRMAVLEIGCAPGALLGRLKREAGFAIVDGVEVPWSWDEIIQGTAGCRVNLWHGVFPNQSAPLPSDFYDLIISLDTLEHSHEPQEFLSECCRLLKHGGQLILMLPLAVEDTPERMFNPTEHVYLHSLGNLRAMLCDAGLQMEDIACWTAGHDVITARRMD